MDLFAGPGGLDLAAEILKRKTIGIEWDDDAFETREAAKLLTVHGDVRDYGPNSAKVREAKVLAGGPPCQTFTVAGSGAGRRALEQVLSLVDKLGRAQGVDDLDLVIKEAESFDDERTALVLQPLKWALEAHFRKRPYEAIVLEQVPAVLPVWEAMGEVLERIGYQFPLVEAAASEEDGQLLLGEVTGARRPVKPSPRAFVLHTEEYGVPQTRRRAVLLARLGERPRFPEPTHRRYRKGVAASVGAPELEPWVSMRTALGRKDHFVVVSNYGTGGDPKARGRRDATMPSATVTGKISRNRLQTSDGRDIGRFTHQEAGQLQSFPRAYPWRGGAIAQQIGNAIPPRLGVHILSAALELEPPGQEEWERLENWTPPAASGPEQAPGAAG
ncbi:DNA cytosine methyltransferase [Streptomyces sp. MI02-2A]|uniref:DNA cytosine methyltransferase n=1 Tax=Streptomyces sp. MI02-2A TaxID=3028688 RepID=UPI0029BCDE0A|nr:DNA cytosine methyltransferase [Streptomyces sp. MI02-2A]MDX3265984.1 DNA cytosine methyltransferase [Streptomyces sp. MI02-2A]